MFIRVNPSSAPRAGVALAFAGLALAAGVVLRRSPAWWPIAGTVLVAPLLEELVFRRGLHESLLRWARLAAITRRFGGSAHAAASNAITAVVFAAAHVIAAPGWLAAATLAPALVIGSLYNRGRRLWPCMLLHAAFNLAWIAALRGVVFQL